MNTEKEIKKEEKIIEGIVKQEIKKGILSSSWVGSVVGIIIILLCLGVFIFIRVTKGQIRSDNALIDAPIISLSSSVPGILEEIYVKVGDNILPNTPVAKVGNETIMSRVGGIVISLNHQEGQFFSPGMPVVSMINTNEERVVAKIDENKGLEKIKVGQSVIFTVDTFGSKKYEGVIDEVSPVSDESSVVFSISDKRATKQFDVKIRFDIKNYPELKKGMSAKVTIFTN